jgi:hypothetical protein
MNKLFYMPGPVSGGGDPIINAGITSDPKYFQNNGMAGDKVDVADILSNFVGRGDKDLSGGQAKKDYQFLIGKVGAPLAQKLVGHVLTFNQRPDMQKQPFAAKLNNLYSMGSNDKDVDKILKTQLGAGPVALANSSPEVDTGLAAKGINPASVLTTGSKLMPNSGMIAALGGR